MPTIQVLPFEKSFECSDSESLLAAALRQGLYLRYGCKHGGCGSCKVRVVDGEVHQGGAPFALSADEQADGWVLLCTARPLEDCVLDVASMGLSEDEFLSGDRPGTFLAEIEHNRLLTPTVRGLRLRLREPADFCFTAGQFINVELPGTNLTRSYSIASPTAQTDAIDLLIKVLPDGAFSGRMERDLPPGTQLRFYGPFGQMRVRLSHRPIVMIAGGTGIAPLLSMLAGLAAQNSPRPVTFFFSVRSAEELFGLDRLRQLQAVLPALEIIPTLSGAWPSDWTGETGRIPDVLERRLPVLEDHDAYVCGPPGLVDAVVPVLLARGVRRRNVYHESFAPTGWY